MTRLIWRRFNDYTSQFWGSKHPLLYHETNQSNNKWKNEKIFFIECFMANYDEKNEAIQKRHSKLFKNDKYSFCPSDDLVKSILFEFIRTSKRINISDYQTNGWRMRVKYWRKLKWIWLQKWNFLGCLGQMSVTNNQLSLWIVLSMKFSWRMDHSK